MRHHKLLQALLFAGLSLFFASAVFAQQDAIEKRQKLMKDNSAAVKAIKGAVESKDYATIETKAKDISANADKIPDLFPKGSTSEKSRALPAIWEKWDEFTKNAGNLKKAANDLSAAANSKDEKIGEKVKALGDVCGGCHKNFRAEEKKG
jgi:cytochrome c556